MIHYSICFGGVVIDGLGVISGFGLWYYGRDLLFVGVWKVMFNHEPRDYKCLFCGIVKDNFDGAESKKEDVVYKDDEVTAFVGSRKWPNNPGIVVVVPNRHFENIYDIDEEVLGQVYGLSKRIAIVMKRAYGCDGVSIRQHNEPAGNQDVWHYHLHVIPRWEGDRLYQRHDEIMVAPEEERKVYAGKLQKYLEGKK